jgi:hypothetical protein
MQFDSETAQALYAGKDSDELIRIAFLESDFIEEAKALARLELARRGMVRVASSEIERVRAAVEQETRAKADEVLSMLESEDDMSPERRLWLGILAPYRKVLQAIALLIMAFFGLNALFDWGLFGLSSKQSASIATLIALFVGILFRPTRQEYLREHGSKKLGGQ